MLRFPSSRRRQYAGRPYLLPGIALLALLVPALITGCGSTAGAHAGTLRLPVYGPIRAPDPARASTPGDILLDSLLYSGLMKFGPDLHVIPELAVSIPTISTDGRSYTFTIRRDAHFADGRTCTAYDVAYSLTRALSPTVASPAARRLLSSIVGAEALERGQAGRLSGVRVLHRFTLRIRLWRADAAFLAKLAFPPSWVVDRRSVGVLRTRAWLDRAVGTGPWRVAGQGREGALQLVPRHHYYGSALQLRSLQMIPVRGERQALELYRKGELDAARVPSAEWNSLASHSDFHQSDALSAFYALPTRDGKTLASSIDRDTLVSGISGQMVPLTSIVPPAVPDYVPSVPTIEPAHAELADGPGVRLDVPGPSRPPEPELVRALYRQWSTSKADPVRVRVVRVSQLVPDPLVWLRLLRSRTESHWYRRLLARAAGLTNDPVTRMDAYSRIEGWALAKGLIIPLASESVGYVVKPSVQSLQVTPLGIMPENNNWATVDVT